jgi:hypothetical protein
LTTDLNPSMIEINISIAAPMAYFPFGGTQGSLFGDIKGQGREIFQFFIDTKGVITRWFYGGEAMNLSTFSAILTFAIDTERIGKNKKLQV